VSAISVWEIAVKVQLGKLALSSDLRSWFEKAKLYPGISLIPVDAEQSIMSAELPGVFHKDPADRLIVSLARSHAVPLATHDEKILASPHVQTIS